MQLSEILHSFRAQHCWNLGINVSHQCSQDGVVIDAKNSAALSYAIFSYWRSIPRSCVSLQIPYVTSISDQHLNIKKNYSLPQWANKKGSFLFTYQHLLSQSFQKYNHYSPLYWNSYSPHAHPGRSSVQMLFLLVFLSVACCPAAKYAIKHNQEKN